MLMLRFPLKRRGEGRGEREEGGRWGHPIDLIISIPYQDVIQYVGEMFCSVFQVNPSFPHFAARKYLHVLFISIKKGKM